MSIKVIGTLNKTIDYSHGIMTAWHFRTVVNKLCLHYVYIKSYILLLKLITNYGQYFHENPNKKIGVVIILLSLISFTLDKFKIIFNFTLFDILAALLGIFLIIFSIINLWFFKKKNYFQINIVLIFFIIIFQTLRLNNFNVGDLSKEQICVYKNIEHLRDKDNIKKESEYLSACRMIRN